MGTIEEKAYSHVDRIFREIIDKYQSAPWNEFRDTLAQIYLAGAKEALAGQWRNVADELPKAEQDVLVAMGYGEFGVAWLSSLSNGTCKWYSNDNTLSLDNIRYWMPIPELPNDECK